jgi:tape measure domain-containing protein
MSVTLGNLDIGVAFVGDASGMQAATAKVQADMEKFGTTSAKAMRQVREDASGAEQALSRLSTGLKGAAIGSSVAVAMIKLKNTIADTTAALIDAQVQLDKWNNGFKFGAGSMQAGAAEMAFVREEAMRLGLELSGATTQYMKFVAASRGSSLQGDKTRELFTSIAEAATVMGMSGEQAERAMNAVVQMMSKGKVQAEELRGQLGEHLPGAFSIAARAMGVTEMELNKLMETGQLMSTDFLPKFGAQLRKELGGSVEDASKSMQASLNRYTTAWLSFKQSVAQSGAGDFIGGQINVLADAVGNISNRMDAARTAGGGFWSQTAAGVGGLLQFANPLNAFEYSVQTLDGRLQDAQESLTTLQDRAKTSPESPFFRVEIAQTRILIAELERAKLARSQLSAAPGPVGSVGSGDSALARANAADYDKRMTAYKALMGTLATPAEKFNTELAKQKALLGDLFTPEVEARLRANYIKPTKEAKAATDELSAEAKLYESALQDIGRATIDAEAGANGYTKTQKTLLGIFASPGFASMPETWKQTIVAQADAAIAAEQLADGYKATFEASEQARKAAAAYASDLDRVALADADVIQKANEYTDSIDERVRATEFEFSLMGQTAQARQIALKQYAIEIELQKKILAIKREMASEDEQTQAIARVTAAANRAKANAAAEVVNDEFQRTADQIEQSLTDALMRGFESGKGFAQVLRDTVVNMFKTMVLRPVVQATVQGGLNSVGLGNLAGGQGSNLLSAGGLVGSLGSAATYGTAIGSQQGAMLAAQEMGMGTLAGSMGSIGEAMPNIGAILAVASLISSLDDSGTMHTGGVGGYSAMGGTRTGAAAGLRFGVDAKDYTSSAEQAATAISKSIVGMLDATAKTFGQEAGYYAATAFADDTSRDGAWGALLLKMGDKVLLDWGNNPSAGGDANVPRVFANGEEGAQQYAAAVAVEVRDYLLTQTPDWADTMLTALGEAPSLEQLGAVVQQINAAAAAFEAMGQASAAFATLGDAATTSLVNGLGGADAAVGKLSSYYTEFYSESERTALATQQLTGQFSSLGRELPNSRDALRSMVDAALAAGDTTLAAGLLNLTGAFAGITPAAEDAAKAVAEITSKLQSEFASLQRELLTVSGGDVRGFDTTGYTPEQVAAYDRNEAIRAQIAGAKAAQEAGAAAMKASADAWADAEKARLDKERGIADERAGLERQILEAQGDTAAIRNLERAALDDSNRALFDRINALQDEQAVKEQAKGLERQLLEAQGNTAAIRALERAEVSETNRALFDRIAALEDEKTALAAATAGMATYRSGLLGIIDTATANTDATMAAFMRGIESQRKLAETSKAAAEKLNTEVQGIFDTLQSSVDSLFGSVDSARDFQAQQGSQFISAALAAARATGALPDGKDLSRAIAAATGGLEAQQYATQAEADFARLVLANELKDLQDISGDQLTEAERQVRAAEDTLTALDDAATLAQNQLDTMRGVRTDTATIAQLVEAIARESASRQQVAASALIGTGQAVYNTATNAGANATGQAFTRGDAFAAAAPFATGNANDALALYSAAQQSGFSLGQLEKIYGQTPGTLEAEIAKIEDALGVTLPRFAVGTNYVPQDMLAMVHQGEAIVPAAYNPMAGGNPGGNQAELLAELRLLRQQNERLEARLQAIEGHTGQFSDQFDRVSAGGNEIASTFLVPQKVEVVA